MKILTLLLALTAFAASAQTTRIADNNPTRPAGPNIYATLQAAIDAAALGDIIYVQPSLTTYGDVSINKQITLRGMGFNTGKDLAYSSVTGDITLTNTVDNSTTASGTLIEGICVCTSNGRINLGVQSSTLAYTLRNITISKCALSPSGVFRAGGYGAADNIVIKDCFTGIQFDNTGTVSNLLVYRNFLYQIFFNSGSLSSAIFSNNISDRGNQNQFGIFGNLTTNSLIITNNNFLGETDINGTRFMNNDLHDAIVANNIFYGCAPNFSGRGDTPFARNTFTNNLSFGTSNDALPPLGNGVGNNGANNKESQNPKFVNAPFNTNWSATWDFTLQVDSPAKNAGSDGTDIGITGGSYPVNKNLNTRPTSAPVILQFNPSAVVPQNQPLKTNVKAKAN